MGSSTSVFKKKMPPSKSEMESIPYFIDSARTSLKMDLTSKALSNIPEQVFRATYIQTLILNDNEISLLEPAISKLKKLQDIQIRNNKLELLPSEISSLSGLSSMSLTTNKLSNIPPEIGFLTLLEEFVLWGNRLSTLPDEIGSLKKINVLDLSNNRLSMLTPSIGFLDNISELKIGHNLLQSIPPEIGRLTAMVFLDLSSNKLGTIPKELWDCKSLGRLVLKRNVISYLPMPTKNMLNMIEVNLEKNQLTHLDDLSFFPKMKKLILTRNKLSTIPDSVSQLSHLNMLLMEFNPVSHIPSFVFKISSLGTLHLSGHAVKRIPEEFTSAKSLSIVHLRSGSLEHFPKYLCDRQEKLHKLDLSNNEIKHFPEDCSGLCFLHELKLNENQIMDIPDGISDLTSLQVLNLHSNMISSLPWSIRKLYLSYNQISNIPKSIASLSSLQELHLSSNPIRALPEEFSCLTYLRSLWMASICPKNMNDILDTLSKMPWITFLDLSRNEMGSIPDFIWAKPNQLIHVNLSSNNISQLPTYPFVNHKIKTFDLSLNPIPIDRIKISNLINDIANDVFKLHEDIALVPSSFRVEGSFISCIGRRNYMEDFVCVVPSILGKYTFFGIFDGHDGKETSLFLKTHFAQILERNLKILAPKEALRKTYDDTERALRSASIGTSGSTALTILMDQNYIYCANAGDSRAVLFRQKEYLRISTDHKPFVTEEHSRIRESGGFVTEDGRVSGILSMSRAFGDYYLHPYVTWEPSIQVIPRSDSDEWLVLASDGLWDTVPDKMAFEVLQSCATGKEAVYKLRDRAFLNESADNTSVIALRFVNGSFRSHSSQSR